MFKVSIVLGLVGLLAAPLVAQQAPSPDPVVAKIIEEGRQNSQVQAILRHLTKEIGPRLTGSTNLTDAMKWATEKLESWGLEAKMVPWGTYPIGFDRGRQAGRMVAPTVRDIEFASRTWTGGTDGPKRGPVVLMPQDEEEFERRQEEFKGAWVMRSAVASGRRGRRGGGNTMLGRLEEAGAHGFVDPSRNNRVYAMWRFRGEWEDRDLFPQVQIRRDTFDEIIEMIELGETVELEFDLVNEFKRGPIQLYNVIADVKGSEFPDEYVVFGGHCDSWDGAEGCTDNGTGTSTTMEAARLFATAVKATGKRPRRTVRFMLWSGEEQGLLGSRGWVDQNPDELPKISGAFVHDMGTNYLSGLYCTPAMEADIEKAFAPVKTLNPDEFPFKINVRNGLPQGGGSDHASFRAKGVPGFFWNQAGRAEYGHTWHTQNDKFEAAIPEYQQHSSMVVALGAWGLANLDGLLDRRGIDPPRLGVNPDGDMKVLSVTAGGVAEQAGVKAGDKLLRIGDVPLRNRRSLRRAIADGGTQTLIVERDGKEVELTLKWPGVR